MSELGFDWAEEAEREQRYNGRKATKEKMKCDSRENSHSRKRVKHNSENDANSTSSASKTKKLPQVEVDPLVLQRRQKQIDYGKNTVGYHNYIAQVPIASRTKDHPRTPDKYTKYSRRSWDMLIKIWRKKLHEYDVDGNSGDEEIDDSDLENGK